MKTDTNEIRDMSDEEIKANIQELETELMKARAEGPIAGGMAKAAEGSSLIKGLRKDIARHKTIPNERRDQGG